MKVISAVAVVVLQAGLAMASLTLCAAAQNPFAALENAAKEKAAEEALTKVLNDNLPLTLNAKDVYPTVTTLPGGPFSPTPLKLTADQLDQPLPPGDYTINTLDFCSQYSVHQPGAGLAYVLGPYEGKAAGAIGALIWRGTEQYHAAPQSLQAVSWAIQSGLTYAQMPKTYQAIIDQVIPDFKSEITGDFAATLENTYNSLAKAASLPPLDTILAKLGDPGKLALDAERQRQILTAQNTNDQIKEQTLFQGQESGVYTPVKVETGPWTERVKGQVYMKLLIAGGNMATNNVMQIRVMPSPTANARLETNGPGKRSEPHLVRAAYGGAQVTPAMENEAITVANLVEGTLGYSQGQGAQALGQVVVVASNGPVPAPAPAPTCVPAPKVTAQPASCTKAVNAASTPLNFAFTSYTSAVSNDALYKDFQGLYNASFEKGVLCQDSFADRMNQVAASGKPVGFFVVNGDDPQYLPFRSKSLAVYSSNTSLIVPNADEFAMTIAIPQSQGGGYEVVISQQALMNGYYASNAAKVNPVTEPMQMPMAYELGTNVYNMVKNPRWCEQMTQKDTNRFITAEFPWFPQNSSGDSGSAFYGDVKGQPQHDLHGVLDLFDPSARGTTSATSVIPTSSLYTDPAQGAKTQQGQIWIPPN